VLIKEGLLSTKKRLGDPIGKIAERTIGYERKHLLVLMMVKVSNGRRKYLNGKDKILKQK
jgi:hypothetical protein